MLNALKNAFSTLSSFCSSAFYYRAPEPDSYHYKPIPNVEYGDGDEHQDSDTILTINNNTHADGQIASAIAIHNSLYSSFTKFMVCGGIPLLVSSFKVLAVLGNSMFTINKFLGLVNGDSNADPDFGFQTTPMAILTTCYILLLVGDLIITANRGPGTFRHYAKKYMAIEEPNKKTPWEIFQEKTAKIDEQHLVMFTIKCTPHFFKFLFDHLLPAPRAKLSLKTKALYYVLISFGYVSSSFAALSNYFGVSNFINFLAKNTFRMGSSLESFAFTCFREIFALFTAFASYLSSLATTQPSQNKNSNDLCESISNGKFKFRGHSWGTYLKVAGYGLGTIPTPFLNFLTTSHSVDKLASIGWMQWLENKTTIRVTHIGHHKALIAYGSAVSGTTSSILSVLFESMKTPASPQFKETLWYEIPYKGAINLGSGLIFLENFLSNFSSIAIAFNSLGIVKENDLEINDLKNFLNFSTNKMIGITGTSIVISLVTVSYIYQVYRFYCEKIKNDNLKHWHEQAGHHKIFEHGQAEQKDISQNRDIENCALLNSDGSPNLGEENEHPKFSCHTKH